MTNEEKILQILGVMQGDMAEIKDDLKGLHAEMHEVKDDLTRVKAYLEVDVDKRLDALGEGHELLLQTLAHNDRVEEAEDEIRLLWAVVKEHSRQIAALKRAL